MKITKEDILYKDGSIFVGKLRNRFNGYELGEILETYGIVKYIAPSFDPMTHKLGNIIPYSEPFHVTKEVLPLTQGELEAKLTEVQRQEQAIKDAKIEQLWQSANEYQEKRISGGALIEVNEMAKAGIPEAIEVKNWIKKLWMDDYYVRKASIQAGTFDDNYDFSNNGEIPYTVFELMQIASL